MARWLRGDALRRRGDLGPAEQVLRHTLADADLYGPPRIKTSCNTSLGLLFLARGEHLTAETFFRAAIALIEELRAPLPGEEFRTAFLADHLRPYHEMMRLCLAAGSERTIEAWEFCERAKSRALVDLLGEPGGTAAADLGSADPEFDGLRDELNWYYSQLNRPQGRTSEEITELHTAVRTWDTRLEEIARRRQLHGRMADGRTRENEMSLAELQQQLGADSAVVEYALLDDRWLAFVVTDERVDVVRGLAPADAIRIALDQFRFQIDGLRFGSAAMRRHLPRLTEKIQAPLRALYDLLLAPLAPLIGGRRLAIVPQGDLHYVPFQTLFDGTAYVIETREVTYAPSAGVLAHCLTRPAQTPKRAVLLGVPDESTPLVEDEINRLVPFFGQAEVLLHDRANLAELRRACSGTDVLHLACHGQFRPDNPMFSSLRLSNEWLTARDLGGLDLRGCGLVTLSACETGLSGIRPGDEIMGLARGFFAAGAASLLLSQWVVDDTTTARLMIDFYRGMSTGSRPAAALRAAQCEALREMPHPFFWSPFVLMGRW
jgi:CHAT domain-containing protein